LPGIDGNQEEQTACTEAEWMQSNDIVTDRQTDSIGVVTAFKRSLACFNSALLAALITFVDQ